MCAQDPPPTVRPTFDETVVACDDLRRALGAAGIGCFDPEVDEDALADDPVVCIRYLTSTGAATLVSLLRAGSGASPETVFPARPLSTAEEEAVAIGNDLQKVLVEVGIDGLLQVEAHPRGGPPVMHLERLDGTHTAALTARLHKGLREHFDTAGALHAAFRAHGLDAGLPIPVVRGLRIRLGDATVHAALALGSLLGAAPVLTKLAEVPDYPESEQVMDRLHQAVKATTSGFMDVELHPNCMKCGHLPTITLGALELDTAKRLVTALRHGDAL
ncbi:hypothetical protein [Streptomyces colonosanans]|uniref:Uncharacterized protein n=1 Tax=Streptomyces colonosanans TaxID=1428652 RepID=A0A1S2NY61_9ACTN|nr:hypothetical protein [Streptomyces colonosanans]OIJ86420.1 hypothetical protein BIV24_26545 [Streptomyces colonosanans]